MTDDVDQPQEARVYLARDDRKSSRMSDTIIAALIGGAVAVTGMIIQDQQANEAEETTLAGIEAERVNTLDIIESERKNVLAEIELARTEAESRLTFDIRSHILSFSEGPFAGSGTYEGQISAVMRAFELGELDGALSVHYAFRNGATIRALEQLQLRELSPTERTNINNVLGAIPKVLFLESRLSSNIYCESLVGTGRTNIDAFAPEIRDLPIRMAARSFYPGDDEGDEIKAIAELVGSAQPDLIVAHLSTFESESDGNRIAILQKIIGDALQGASNYFPSIVLYSRLPRGQTEGVVNFPAREEFLTMDRVDKSFFATIPMVGHDEIDSDCFLDASVNSMLLREQLILAMAHQSLYSRNYE